MGSFVNLAAALEVIPGRRLLLREGLGRYPSPMVEALQNPVRSPVQEAVSRAQVGARRLGSMSLVQRIVLIDDLRRGIGAEAEAWVRTSCESKGIDPDSNLAAEEWLNGPMSVLRNLRLLRRTLLGLAGKGTPLPTQDRNGCKTLSVLPRSLEDRVLFLGFRAGVWFEPGVEVAETRPDAKTLLDREPGVAALLSAGNVTSIGPQDFIHLLFSRNRACVLKAHPVNEVLVPHLERAFQAAMDLDLLQIVVGGAQVGAELVSQEAVDEVHITGSAATYDAIVWGSGDQQESNRAANTPRLQKPISAELGCVTPVIVTPGVWSPKELRFQAENVATMLTNNASFNCVAAKVLVTSSDWPQREEFLDALAEVLAQIPTRRAYYPGAVERHASFCAAFPQAKLIGQGNENNLPWALATGLDPEATDSAAFTQEAWCGVLAETALPGASPKDFLPRAVDFCNGRLFGSLSCTLIIDPRSAQAYSLSYEAALTDLRYGSIAVNHWSGLSYGMGVVPWGAHPGHTPRDIQSGVGFVHNTLLLEGVEKSVLEGPFMPPFKPLWFASHKNALKAARALTRYEEQPGLGSFLSVLSAGLRG